MYLKNDSSFFLSKLELRQKLVKVNSLRKICKLAILIGLPITVDHSDGRYDRKPYAPAKLWVVFINTIKALALVTSAYFIRRMIPSPSVRLTLYASIVGGWAIDTAIIIKRKEISVSLYGICNLSIKMGTATHIGNKSINKLLFFHITTFTVFATFMCVFFFYQEWDRYKASSAIIVGPDILRSVCQGLVFSAIIFSFCFSGATCGTTLLLCDSAFIALSDLIEGFCTNLKQQFRRRMFSRSSISAEIGILNAITAQVKVADKALNDCTLMLYGMFACLFYITVSIALSKEAIFKTKMVTTYIAWNFILVGLIFRRLTLSGDRVAVESQKLRSATAELSRRIVDHCADEKTLLAFNILLGNIKDSKLVVTAGGMFVIEKGLFLTVIGTMVTYGVILFQGNRDTDSTDL